MTDPRCPSLYQVNTRVWLTDRARALGRAATLDDIPDDAIDELASMGFDWIWLLSVWQTGIASRTVSRTDPAVRRELAAELPDLRDEDIAGSGFAITGYVVHEALGDDDALARLRERLAARGLKLMLDFVPNHTALDHPWVRDHEDFYVHGTELDALREPANYTWVDGRDGRVLLAYGRDPYFPGWTDTLQLDYANPATVEAMSDVLLSVASRCDGVRCDMAMLVLPDVFERTWGRPARPFWPDAIARARQSYPAFRLIAEAYWDLEWTLIQQGFDGAYDKRLYDRLVNGAAGPVRAHLSAPLDYQSKMVRFLENHDEPRAATAFPPGRREAAAVITYLAPGMRFFHQGQLEGRRVHVSPHLVRGPDEPVDPATEAFYARLLAVLRDPATRDGDWQLLDCRPAWEGNPSSDGFVAVAWLLDGLCWIVVVNFAPDRGQARVWLPFDELAGCPLVLTDHATDAPYERDGDDLVREGLYVDLPGWGRHLFAVSRDAGTDGTARPSAGSSG